MSLDIRQVVRNLIRHPGFAIVTVVTLALGIGANTVIFSVVNSVLLQPLPFPDADRLVRVYHSAPGLNIGMDDIGLADATYFFFRDSGVLEDLAVYNEGAANLSGGDTPERVDSLSASHSLFATLGVPPTLGRPFAPEDELPDAPPVVILSDGLWRRNFGARTDVIGETVQIDGVSAEIVGVMPPGLVFPRPDIELYEPMDLDPEVTQLGSLGTDSVGKLPPGLTIGEAEAQLHARIDDLVAAFPDQPAAPLLDQAGLSAHVVDMREYAVGDVQRTLWVLMGSVAFILLIACANVANIYLVRADGREREIAIRSALGAGRGQLMTGFLAESIALGLAAGASGLLLAYAGVRALVRFGPERMPRIEEISIDANVLVFTFLLSILVGVLFGLIPALRYKTAWLAAALKEGGRANTAGRRRFVARNLLMGFQVAMALVLLVGSGLMVRSFRTLAAIDPGFDATDVLTFRLALNANDYEGPEAPTAFIQRVLDELGGMPGVRSVGVSTSVPLGGNASGQGFSIEDHPLEPDALPPVHFFKYASPGYFESLQIPLVTGRAFERADHEDPRASAIVNEAFAGLYWPDADPVGRRIQFGGGAEPNPDTWYTIVGVVGNVRNIRLEDEVPALAYFPLLPIVVEDEEGQQVSRSWVVRNPQFAVRTEGGPTALAGPIRQKILEMDPNLPIAGVETMEELLGRAMVQRSFTMLLLLIGSGGALLIGAVGIYGVISYVVSQQTREIGVRMALGAQANDIAWMVLRRSLVVTAIGIVCGVLAAGFFTRFMGAMLYEVEPLDPVTFVTVIVVLAAVAALAAYIPARRAARVDPLRALQYE